MKKMIAADGKRLYSWLSVTKNNWDSIVAQILEYAVLYNDAHIIHRTCKKICNLSIKSPANPYHWIVEQKMQTTFDVEISKSDRGDFMIIYVGFKRDEDEMLFLLKWEGFV